MHEHLELPRPWRLMRTAGWNLTESAVLPFAAYLIANTVAGRTAGVLAGLGAVWLMLGLRKWRTGQVSGLLMISAVLMCVQTALVLATGQAWIYLLQFPLAKLILAGLFARTAGGERPLVGRLASEMISLRVPGSRHQGVHRFFQGATWLWAGIFGLLAVGFAVLVATESISVFMVVSTALFAGAVSAGIGVSLLWFRAVARRHGLRLRFAPA